MICRAEEITPFKLTGVEGHIIVDYLSDGLSTGQPGGSVVSEQNQAILREEIFLMTHSYVYHPNFLTLDIGGGPIRQDTQIDFNGNTEDSGENLYNFTARANFLRNKPVRGSLFYDHLNPTVSVAPGEIMVQENSRYGFDFSMSNPGVGLPFNLGHVHTQTQGNSARRTIDDSLDQFYFNISRSYGALGSTNLQYQATDQTSRSGSLSLPIQETRSTSQGVNVNSRLRFGENQQYHLSNYISYNTRTYSQDTGDLPDQDNLAFLLDLRARPSDKLNLFGTYHYNSNDQDNINLVSQSLSGGLTYLPLPDLEASAGIRLEQNDANQYTVQSQAIDGSLRYKCPLGVGNLQASYSARYELRDQEAVNPLVNIIDEQHTLMGTNQVTLGHSYVQAGSVIVTNQAQTQTYVENVDYLLIVIGSETRIERLGSGSILDGEVVLVDYIYDIGGTFTSTQLDQTFNLNWNISRQFNSYLRWFRSSPEVTSGTSTFPLNPVNSVVVGAHGEAPMPFDMPFSVGGSLEFENRDERISPYRRTSGDVFLQSTGPLFGLANMRLTGRRSRIEYDFSPQDVDLTGYDLRLWTRRYGIEVNGVLGYEEDNGSPIRRTRWDASLNAVWRERKVTVTASLLNTVEEQDGFERDHVLFRLTARRDF